MAGKKHIAYYVSAHGYGHGVRSSDIVRALRRDHPGIAVTLISELPQPFLRNRLGPAAVRLRAGAFDVGMVQLDSIRVDVPATLAAVQKLLARKEQIMEGETSFFRKEGISLVVADIPAVPLEAARRHGLPGLAVGNFAWDWIYDEFAVADPRWAPVVREFEHGYRQADLLLRLPFHEPMQAFPRKEDIPLVASPGRNRRSELARLTGAAPERKWVLLSFTSLDWDLRAVDNVEELTDYEFFTVKPLEWKRRNIHPVSRDDMPFSDVLASADAVISKPGFGLVSECVVNRKPLVHADRTDFREYPVLLEAVRKYLRQCPIPAEALYRGEVRGALDALWTQPEPKETVPSGGAEIAARRIVSFL
ncbi:MAG: hypothetical protein V1873_00825 [Verrucomicrobiota bacterium]